RQISVVIIVADWRHQSASPLYDEYVARFAPEFNDLAKLMMIDTLSFLPSRQMRCERCCKYLRTNMLERSRPPCRFPKRDCLRRKQFAILHLAAAGYRLIN